MLRGRGGGRGRGRGRGKFVPIQVEHQPTNVDKKASNSSRDGQYCSYCKVELGSKKLFNDHIQSAVHKQKEILIGKALSDGLHFCYTCEKIFPSKIELDAHCLMTRHQPLYRVEEFHNTNDETLAPIKVQQPETTAMKDRKGIVMDLQKLRNDNREGGDGNDAGAKREYGKSFYCELCSVDCLNQNNYKMHIESWRHRAEVDKKRDAEKQKYEAIQQRRENEERMKTPSHLIEKVGYFCEVCSVPQKSEKDYFDHLRSRRHLRQVSSLRRPFKCYICNMETSVEKDFNYHLASKSHMGRAFKSVDSPSKGDRKDDDWVEKKKNAGVSVSQKERRQEDSKDRRSVDSTGVNRSSQRGRDVKDHATTPSSVDDRRVEIVNTPLTEGPVADLRDKLKLQKIVITKPNDQEKRNESNEKELKKDITLKNPPNSNSNEVEGQTDLDKRAKQMEFEAKFRKLEKEYANDAFGFQARLKADREEDIAKYQHFEGAYNRLCREEDYIREDLRVLKEGDPRKEAYIRDMIKIQQEMREVRQELEVREMMIIRRETLFREKFPENKDKQVVVNTGDEDNKNNEQPSIPQEGHENQRPQAKVSESQSEDDLRIQLERERLLKRLGPELSAIDPTIKEKLLAAIFDKDTPAKGIADSTTTADNDTTKESPKDEKRENQMKYLTEREKQLERELADLKSSATQKKKLTTSLVPQYDDVDEKKDKKKQRVRKQSESGHSSSGSSSDSDSSVDSRSRKKDRKRRRGSPSKPRGKKHSISPERRKKRHRSSSRERERRKKRRDDKRSKSDRSKSDRRSKTTRSKNGSKENPKAISVIGGNSSSVAETKVPPLSRYQQVLQDQQREQVLNHQQQQPNNPNNYQRRESSSFWKNPVSSNQAHVDSPKEDVWDIAFSGGHVKGEPEDALNIFNAEQPPATFSQEILNILRNVVPSVQQQTDIPDKKIFPGSAPVIQQPSSNSRNLYDRQPPQELSYRQSQVMRPVQQLDRPIPQITPPSFNSNNRHIIPARQEYSRITEPDKGKVFPVPIPDDIPQPQNKSFTTSTPLPGTGAGGRVRSILKKMKNPPAPIVEEASFIASSSASEPASSAIPGLDTLAGAADKDGRDEGKERANEKHYVRSKQESLYDSQMDDRNLYGGNVLITDTKAKDIPIERNYGNVPRDDFSQQDYRDKNQWPVFEHRRIHEDERNVGQRNMNSPFEKPRDQTDGNYGTERLQYESSNLIYDRRYATPTDADNKSAGQLPRSGFDMPAKKGLISTSTGSFPSRSYDSENRRYDDVTRKVDDDVHRRQDMPVSLFPPVRMEGESNASYDERYRIYLELKRRKEDEERRRNLDGRPPLGPDQSFKHSNSPHTIRSSQDEVIGSRESLRHPEERMAEYHRGGLIPPASRCYDVRPVIRGAGDDVRPVIRGAGDDVRPVIRGAGDDVRPVIRGAGDDTRPVIRGAGDDTRPVIRGGGDDYQRDHRIHSSFPGGSDVKRVQDERVRITADDRSRDLRRVEDTSPFMEDKMRDGRPYEMRDDSSMRPHDTHRDTFFRRDAPTYRDDHYNYTPGHGRGHAAPPMHDQRRAARQADEPAVRSYRERSPPREHYRERPLDRQPYSYHNY